MTIEITIAVLTFNSEKTLERCIASIINQEYTKDSYEIIVIDNGSTDKTIDILQKYKINYWVHPELNISQLRNIALNRAAADLVGFVDSDCIIAPDWVSNALSSFNDENVAIVGYKYMLPDDATFFEKNWYAQSKREVSYSDIIPAGNMVVSKKIVMDLHGFDESIATGEDADLLQRVRRKSFVTVSNPDIKNKHLGNAKGLLGFFKKELWYGLGTKWKEVIFTLDKPFIMSMTFFIALLLLVYGILAGVNALIASSAAITLMVPLIAALDRKFRKNISGNLIYMMLVYVVYFAARNAAFVCYLLNIKSVERKSN